MNRVIGSLAIVAAFGFSVSTAAAAYKEGQVSNGGTIAGKVTFAGTPPPPKLHELGKFPQAEFCGKADNDGKGNRVQHLVRVNGGALNDVVVFIEDIKEGKPFKFDGTDVVSDICRFLVKTGPSDFVGVVKIGEKFRVQNLDADPNDPKSADGVLHNPHTYNIYGNASRTIFNKPLSTKGQKIEYKLKKINLKKSPIMFLQCDQHNYMEAWFYAVDNPYYAVVGQDGTFKIDQVPPGEYELYAWHPMMEEPIEQKIKVTAGGSVTANFNVKDSDIRLKGGEQK